MTNCSLSNWKPRLINHFGGRLLAAIISSWLTCEYFVFRGNPLLSSAVFVCARRIDTDGSLIFSTVPRTMLHCSFTRISRKLDLLIYFLISQRTLRYFKDVLKTLWGLKDGFKTSFRHACIYLVRWEKVLSQTIFLDSTICSGLSSKYFVTKIFVNSKKYVLISDVCLTEKHTYSN